MKRFLSTAVALVCCVSSVLSAQNDCPYKNPALPTEARVNDLLGRMTLEEKIAQIRHLHSWDIYDGQILNAGKLSQNCSDVAFGFFEGFPLTAANCKESFRQIQKYFLEETRLGIPAFSVAESLHGVVHEGATVFPQNIAMGSTFNPELAYRKTQYISGELNTMGVRQVLAPCIDVARDLRWGRVEESFSEDPFLCSQMAVSEVKGYLDNGISPMLKHYGPHGNPLGGLNLASVECGVRDLFDVYLKPFEEVFSKTNVMAVMSSYNSWNRVPNSASKFLLTDVLRNKFGFRGYVYSDWGVINMLKNFHHTAATDFDAARQALTAGLDVEASSTCFTTLADKVRSGELDVRYIDEAVRRVLRAKFELGLFEDPYSDNAATKKALRSEEGVALSRQIADESTVLLKNEGGLLPLDADKLGSIAVIGPNAGNIQFGDYTWSKNNEDGVTPLQGISSLVGNKVKINYAKGCAVASLDTSGIPEAVAAARCSDVSIVFVGSSSTAFVRYSQEASTSGEGIDLNDIALTGAQEQLVEAVCAVGKPVVVVLVAGKPFAIPWVKENVPAALAQWYAGEQEGNSIADILFGKVNPSGKLNFSFPQSTGHLPSYYAHLSTDKGYYKEPGTYEHPGRDYAFSSPAPLWAFGHGLSYTSFEYLNAETDKLEYNPYDTIRVKVSFRNSGLVPGKEVVQVYVRDVVSTIMTPVQQLKGFSKVEVAPGETEIVEIGIPATELYLTDNYGNRYLEPGEFEIQVGGASDAIAHKLTIYIGTPASSSEGLKDGDAVEENSRGHKLKVSGVVRDMQATPVQNALVSCKDASESVRSDKMGRYTIVVKNNSTLTFSKKGYATKDVKVRSQMDISVQLAKGE